MKCPKCGHEWKDPGRQKGGQISRRKLTKAQARIAGGSDYVL